MDNDFDEQVDKLRGEINKKIIQAWDNAKSWDSFTAQSNALYDKLNRLEVARRIHNHYVETGEVKIPD